MAHQNTEFTIDQGPSKLDLMLSLFDTDMGARTVRFHANEWVSGHATNWFEVKIDSATRGNPIATIWEISGVLKTTGGNKRVSIYYLSDTREGRMRIEETFRTEDMRETPNNSRKANTLLEIIFRMIKRYRESHPGNLDEEIFRLFEKAKRVHYAENSDSLDEAIKNI